MQNTKPVSDLRNDHDIFSDVKPVFLTKDGHGRYAIMNIRDEKKTQAAIRLMDELDKGRRSGETEGWLSLDEVERELEI